jgi:hypothetical protein
MRRVGGVAAQGLLEKLGFLEAICAAGFFGTEYAISSKGL